MRKLLLVLLACFVCADIVAQVPGYKGKKFMLGYSVQVAPNVWNWVENSGSVPFRLHPKHIFSAEYIIGRHSSIALEGGFAMYKRTINVNDILDEVNLNGGFVGASVLIFGENLAPVGNYFSINAQQMFFNFRNEKGWSNDYQSTYTNPITGKFSTSVLGIGFGTRRVFADHIAGDMGLGIGFAFTSFPDNSLYGFGGSQGYINNFMLSRNILTYKVGISGLLF